MKDQMFKVGMYGGSFDPPHMGHFHDIIRASSMCEELFVVISWSEKRESTTKELRYRWINNAFKHLDNIKILLLQDTANSKEEYNDNYWEKGALEIKKMIGKKIDVVFCGSDYRKTKRFENLYGEDSEIIYFEREEIPISSTDIRTNVFKHWNYLPQVCRPYYVKKVLIVGGESTGKSTLVRNLAIAYNTNYVREVGRETCDIAGKEEFMNKDDLVENLLRQKTLELEALYNSNKILFIDTDSITTKFYSKFLLNNSNDIKECSNLADSITAINNFDLVILLEPTVKFIQDGTRNEKIRNNRDKYSEQLKQLLIESKKEYISLSGTYLERFNKTKQIIKDKFDIDV